MTQEDVIRMAREAGLTDPDLGECVTDFGDATDSIHRFAALVAAAEREAMRQDGWRRCAEGQGETQHCALLEAAVLAEREACAKEAKEKWCFCASGDEMAQYIRERGQE